MASELVFYVRVSTIKCCCESCDPVDMLVLLYAILLKSAVVEISIIIGVSGGKIHIFAV